MSFLTTQLARRRPFQWGTFSSTSANYGIPLSASQTKALTVYTDDAGASIAESVRGFLSRTLLTVDQSGASIRAGMGQLKLATGVDVTSGIYTALQGYVELVGATSAKTGSTFSCIDASAELGGVLTVDSGGEFCGIHVETTGAGTITNSGTCAGLLIDMASGAAKWPDAILIDGASVLMGMRIGKFASSGATTNAVPFATTQDVYSDGQLSTMEVHGGSTANLTSAYSAKCGRFRHIVNCTTAAHETYGLMGQCVVKSTTLSHLHSGLIGTFEVQTAATVPSGVGTGAYVSACGVLARVGGSTITIGATGLCAGVISMSNDPTLSVTSGGIYAAFAAVKAGTQGWNTALYVQDTATLAIFCDASDTYVHGVKVVAATPAGNTSHAIKVLVGTTAAYIPAYDNENF